ncbi:uncharacterized protein LOC118477557 [Aplysia californica]|uniref:Uncharacterized protein LOC118477557 n=1 Tax=Aplysia californica TaxID=6500 RepID=A0ABM1VS03_APLCA|nr:uncharacterized protein LOC118477557 [Aplysia californica]
MDVIDLTIGSVVHWFLKGLRIVVDLSYKPPRRRGTSQGGSDCHTDYVHVGNDVRRVDVSVMTSFKFCEEDAEQELVSRGNHLWLAYKASRRPQRLMVRLEARAPATDMGSSVSAFFSTTQDLLSSPRLSSGPCFRCGDGTCIQPRLSLYDISNYGRVLWYLCDGFSHCPDAWDERKG